MFFPKITKRETKFFVLWSVFIIALILLPHLYGYFTTPVGKQFTNLSYFYPEDTNSYFAWINQAKNGQILFEDMFTSEPHAKAFFHPVFLILGLASRVLGLGVVALWYIGQIIANLFLCFSLYLFLSFFIKKIGQRILAFILVTTSAGLGWIFGFASTDTWMPEATIFQSMGWPLLFAITIALMLWVFMLFLKAQREKQLKYIFYAALLALLLAFIHPYDIVTVYGVLGIYTLYLIFSSGRIKEHLLRIFIFLALSLPAPLYNFYLVLKNPVFNQWAQSKTLSPPLYSYLLGFGILIPLATWGIFWIIKEKKEKLYFLLVWTLVSFVLVYLPFNFQRRLIMGIQIPLVILGSIPLFKLVTPLKGRRVINSLPKLIVLGYVLLILCGTNINHLGNTFLMLKKGNYPWYLEKKTVEAIKWLDKNSDSQEVVFASYETGNFIPRFSRHKAFIGHWDQTINLVEKEKVVENFFTGQEESYTEFEEIFKKHKVKYVFWGPYEQLLEGQPLSSKVIDATEKFLSTQMDKVFDNQLVKIFKYE